MKEKFIKSIIYLIIGGFLTKLLGLIIKILTTRYIGIKGISIYTLILPTFSLAMTITQLSLPLSITKLISEEKYNNKNILISALPISIVTNIIIILLLIISSKYLATNLLHDSRCTYPIIAISLTLPFISLSSIIKSYFFGKQQMLPHIISNIIEQITRIILIIAITPSLIKKGIIQAVCGLIISNIISEIISIIILIIFLPKRKLNKKDIIPNKNNIKNILNISIPNTSGRLISSIFYFFEPIIITYTLTKLGYSSTYITTEYGIIEGIVIPLITLPNFFTIAISNSLLPTISNLYSKKRFKDVKKTLNLSLLLSGFIGITTIIILYLFPNFFLKYIYNTNYGKNYLLILLPVFLIYYISPPIASYLQAINKSKTLIKNEIIGITSKTTALLLFPILNKGIYSLIIGIYLNIIITFLLNIREIKKSI